MSVQRLTKTPEELARRRKIKRMTGYESDTLRCSVCKKLFTNREIDTEKVIYSIGRTGCIAVCKTCFKKLYSGGGNSPDMVQEV